MPRLPISTIVIDRKYYPRFRNPKIFSMVQALKAGKVLPPVDVDRTSMKLADGLARVEAHLRIGLSEIDVNFVKLETDHDLFCHALIANASHGKSFTTIDYANIVIKAHALGMDEDEIASLINVTPGFLRQASEKWFARDSRGRPIPLKRSIRHKFGQRLSKDQLDANAKLCGMSPTFMVNQLILILDNDLQDDENENFREQLTNLVGIASHYLTRQARRGVRV